MFDLIVIAETRAVGVDVRRLEHSTRSRRDYRGVLLDEARSGGRWRGARELSPFLRPPKMPNRANPNLWIIFRLNDRRDGQETDIDEHYIIGKS